VVTILGIMWIWRGDDFMDDLKTDLKSLVP